MNSHLLLLIGFFCFLLFHSLNHFLKSSIGCAITCNAIPVAHSKFSHSCLSLNSLLFIYARLVFISRWPLVKCCSHAFNERKVGATLSLKANTYKSNKVVKSEASEAGRINADRSYLRFMPPLDDFMIYEIGELKVFNV